jgi:hypothetical protein
MHVADGIDDAIVDRHDDPLAGRFAEAGAWKAAELHHEASTAAIAPLPADPRNKPEDDGGKATSPNFVRRPPVISTALLHIRFRCRSTDGVMTLPYCAAQ